MWILSSMYIQFSPVQSLSRVWLFATPWIAACQASLSITNSQSSLRLVAIKSVVPSSHLILGHPLLLLPPIPPSIKVFSPVNQLFTWGGQSTAGSASVWVLPMNIQGWFPLGLITWSCSPIKHSVQFSSVQSLSPVRLFVTPWIAACQASLSITNSRSSLRFTSIESVMPSSHLILCRPLLLLPSIPPSISLFQWVNSSHEVAKVLEFQL